MLKRSVIAVAVALGGTSITFAQTVSGTGTTGASNANSDNKMQRVVVTGSNLKRTAAEGTSPIAVMNAQDIKNTGATTVSELMKFVPSMGTDSNQDFASGTGFAKGAATASLRGLGSSSTLVLLNGRRITPAPYADPNDGNSVLYDLNSIPISAIERVEVLQDGASAVYGSDAIAGVINFILKQNYEGAEIGARYGANDDNNFRRKGVNAIFGKGNLDSDGYTFMITGDLNQRDRTLRKDATDVEYEQLKILNGRYKSAYGSSVSQYPTYYKETGNGTRNFGVNLKNAPTNMLFNTGCPASEQITGSVAGNGLLASSTLVGRTFCNFDITPYQEAQGYGRDANIISHGELKLGQNVSAFADVAYSRAQRDYTDVPITIGTGVTTNWTATGPGTPYQTILPIGHPDNPFTDARSSVGYRFTGLRGGSSTINEGKRVLAGLKGSNYGWDWESAFLWNRAENESTQFGRLYLPTLNKLMTQNWSLAQVAADPSIGHDARTENMSQITQWDAKASTEFGHLPGGAIGFAAGVELRREKINLTPDPLVASGQIFGLANTILNSERNVKSAFIEARLPVLKNLEFDFAGRADKYPNLKTNYVPKVGGKWTVTDSFAIRGTYAEGFRAPSLSQVVPGGAQFFLNSVWDPKRCDEDEITPKPNGVTADCSKSVGGAGGFNPNLKPETSKSYNLGFIWSPISKFDVTVDFYKIKRENEIVLGSASDALKNEDQVPGNVVRDTNPANFITGPNGPIAGTGPLVMVYTPWQNRGMTELRGADIEAHLRNNLGQYGSLSTTLRSTYVDSLYIQQFAGDPVHNVVGSIPYYNDWALSSGNPTPRWKSSISTTWKLADHAVNLSWNYVGKISYLRKYDGAETYEQPFCYYSTKGSNTIPLYGTYYPKCEVKEWVTFGLGYTYTGFKNWTLNLNIQNLLDEKAPYDPGYTTSGFNETLHNPYGRYFNLSARYSFK
jgi:iron complex outermembrane receptor protein